VCVRVCPCACVCVRVCTYMCVWGGEGMESDGLWAVVCMAAEVRAVGLSPVNVKQPTVRAMWCFLVALDVHSCFAYLEWLSLANNYFASENDLIFLVKMAKLKQARWWKAQPTPPSVCARLPCGAAS
jgi:hypothetical protein